MKTYMLLAALALVPMTASAKSNTAKHTDAPSAPAAASEPARAELLKDIEAARTAFLPQTEPVPQVTVRYQPRLDDLKGLAVAAKTSAELAKVKKDLNDWKSLVLHELYAENQKAVAGDETYAGFSARKARETDFILAFRQQIAAQRVQAQAVELNALTQGAAANGASWNHVFDYSAASPRGMSGPDNAVRAEAPRAADDPARYDKIRSLLLSQGVSPKIIDTAISEGMRQKVDPMIVLSVINQESNFRKNARNSGSGATGLMQLMPDTAADMGVRGNLYDPATNIKAGVKYLNWIANSFFKMNLDMSDLSKVPAEKLKIVLASYNWGIGNVQRIIRKYGTEALNRAAPRETRNYIAEIPSRIYSWFASF